MKIEVNITKKYFFTILGALLLVASGLFVYAQQAVPNPGHGAESVGPGTFPDGNWRFDGNIGVNRGVSSNWDIITAGDIRSEGDIRADGDLCIDGNCIDSWGQVGSGGASCTLVDSWSPGNDAWFNVDVPSECKNGNICRIMLTATGDIFDPDSINVEWIEYSQEFDGSPEQGIWVTSLGDSGINGDDSGTDILELDPSGQDPTAEIVDDRDSGEQSIDEWSVYVDGAVNAKLYTC